MYYFYHSKSIWLFVFVLYSSIRSIWIKLNFLYLVMFYFIIYLLNKHIGIALLYCWFALFTGVALHACVHTCTTQQIFKVQSHGILQTNADYLVRVFLLNFFYTPDLYQLSNFLLYLPYSWLYRWSVLHCHS